MKVFKLFQDESGKTTVGLTDENRNEFVLKDDVTIEKWCNKLSKNITNVKIDNDSNRIEIKLDDGNVVIIVDASENLFAIKDTDLYKKIERQVSKENLKNQINKQVSKINFKDKKAIVAGILATTMVITGLGIASKRDSSKQGSANEYNMSAVEEDPSLMNQETIAITKNTTEKTTVTTTTEPTTIETTTKEETTTEKEEETTTKKVTTTQAVNSNNEHFDIALTYSEQDILYELADQYDLQPALVFAICEQESGFNKYSDNGTCAGLMQINRCNWSTYGMNASNCYDVRTNVNAGCAIMRYLIDKYGDVSKALVCYNCGEGGAKGISESGYSRSVLAKMDKYIPNDRAR